MQAQYSVSAACFELAMFLPGPYLLATWNISIGHTDISTKFFLFFSFNLKNIHVQMVTGNYLKNVVFEALCLSLA